MQLYTVILKQEHSVSRFDDKGKLISRDTKFVEQVIRDLPLTTANMYRTTSAAGTCEVIMQERTAARVSEGRNHKVRFGDVRQGKSARAESERLAAAPKPKKDPNAALQRAAKTGDLSAAINAGE